MDFFFLEYELLIFFFEDFSTFCSLFSSPIEDKFQNLEWELSDDGHPIIKNTLAWFNCVKWKDYDGGDHQILVGEVKSYNYIEDEPLLYWNGKIT